MTSLAQATAHPIAWRRNLLATACMRCSDHRIHDGHLICDRLGRPAKPDIVEGEPFCPLGRHDFDAIQAEILPPGVTIRTAGDAVSTPPPTRPPAPPQRRRQRRERLQHWLSGAIKLMVVAIGRCRPKEATVANRRGFCYGSPNREPCTALRLGWLRGGTCEKCGCSIKAKTLLATEFCPLKKWPPVRGGRCGLICAAKCLGLLEKCGACGG